MRPLSFAAMSAVALTLDLAPPLSAATNDAATQAARYVPLAALSGNFEVIYGDPDTIGEPFVMRIRELAGTVIPPHSHPVDEHITVLQGTFYFAVSETYDLSLLRALPAGSYAFAPKGSTMFGRVDEAAIVQVHGVGPFHIHWRDGSQALDDPGAATAFRRRRGETVDTPRGRGVIEQGYRSGDIVQYEVRTAAGELFMANESETTPVP